MKHYLPIILYCGWFLMVPPTGDGKVDTSPPITQWKHWQSFDQAGDCESYKVTWGNKLNKITLEMFSLSRCIPADSIPVK